jgi:hypothetical protein
MNCINMSPLRTGFVLSLVVNLVNAAYVSPAVQVPSPLHNSGSIITAGDFNGDTVLDFIVGSSPGFTDYAAVIILGGTFAPDTRAMDFSSGPWGFRFRFLNINVYAQLGTFVGAAGDINNDGLDDVLIGALSSESKRGAVYVVFGFPGPYEDLYLKDLSNSKIGFAITGAAVTNRLSFPPACLHGAVGDVNGDDIDDIAVGDAFGTVFIIYGKPAYAPVTDIDLDKDITGRGLGTKLSEMEIVTEGCASPVLLRHFPAKATPAATAPSLKAISERFLSTPVAEPVSQPVPAPSPQPVAEPVSQPVSQPVQASVPEPVSQPVPQPVQTPVPEPVAQPVAAPSPEPVSQPVPQPVAAPVPAPVSQPVPQPVSQPVPQPVSQPVAEPVGQPVATPVPQPVPAPVPQPVAAPVPQPVAEPVSQPIPAPVPEPVAEPVPAPVAQPVPQPVPQPGQPTRNPTTRRPSQPVSAPAQSPTQLPGTPTVSPSTSAPSIPSPVAPPDTPTSQPSLLSSDVPISLPIALPVPAPTAAPTVPPTPLPPGMTFSPTSTRTAAPTFTSAPTNTPAPTISPAPTVEPTPPALRDYKIAMQVEQVGFTLQCSWVEVTRCFGNITFLIIRIEHDRNLTGELSESPLWLQQDPSVRRLQLL